MRASLDSTQPQSLTLHFHMHLSPSLHLDRAPADHAGEERQAEQQLLQARLMDKTHLEIAINQCECDPISRGQPACDIVREKFILSSISQHKHANIRPSSRGEKKFFVLLEPIK